MSISVAIPACGVYNTNFVDSFHLRSIVDDDFQGMDVIAQTPAGTGKTVTFSIAILEKIDTNLKECQALILVPYRELAKRIQKLVMSLGGYLGVQCHACIGGTAVR